MLSPLDDVDHLDGQVVAHGLEEIPDIIDVVGVRGQQVDCARAEIAWRPDQFLGVAGGEQHPVLVEQVPGRDVGGATVAMHEQHRRLADLRDGRAVRRPVTGRVAAESTDRLPGAGSAAVLWDREILWVHGGPSRHC